MASLSDHFDYLIDDLNLDLVELSVATDAEWTAEKLAQLSAELRDNDVAAVLVQRQPPADLAKAISDGGSSLVLIEDNQDTPIAGLETAIGQVLDALSP